MSETEWAREAACASGLLDPNCWHAEKDRDKQAAAIMVCMGCPVRSECLDDALETRDRWGIRGGFTEDERRKMLNLNQWPPKPYEPDHGTEARYKWETRRGLKPCAACLAAHRVGHRERRHKRPNRTKVSA